MRMFLGLVAGAIGALALALLVYDTLLLRALNRRVVALESTVEAPEGLLGPGPRPAASAVHAPDDPAREARRAAVDEALRVRIESVIADAERRREDERAARLQEGLAAEVEAWAAAARVDAATARAVVEELGRRAEESRAMRQDLRDGQLSFADAREELEAAREESDAALLRLLGAERFDSLQERVMSTLGPPGPAGGFGPPPR